jgi:hypothetical protein
MCQHALESGSYQSKGARCIYHLASPSKLLQSLNVSELHLCNAAQARQKRRLARLRVHQALQQLCDVLQRRSVCEGVVIEEDLQQVRNEQQKVPPLVEQYERGCFDRAWPALLCSERKQVLRILRRELERVCERLGAGLLAALLSALRDLSKARS